VFFIEEMSFIEGGRKEGVSFIEGMSFIEGGSVLFEVRE
jgi:hypothetical protein